jgi:hypothetical protein
VKIHRNPREDKYKRFAKEQEAYRKDVEQAFGVLSRWTIVRHLARQWTVQQIWEAMAARVIMHNMIVEKERDDNVYDQGCDF